MKSGIFCTRELSLVVLICLSLYLLQANSLLKRSKVESCCCCLFVCFCIFYRHFLYLRVLRLSLAQLLFSLMLYLWGWQTAVYLGWWNILKYLKYSEIFEIFWNIWNIWNIWNSIWNWPTDMIIQFDRPPCTCVWFLWLCQLL